tara:strand:- start:660 stop:2192 length:1533 start_codon:yes stop_codon:yes gene_type:complete
VNDLDKYINKVKNVSVSLESKENARDKILKSLNINNLIEKLRTNLENKELPFKIKQAFREELVALIKKRGIVKFDSGNPVEYHIIYDTFSGTLEPVYFWTLDFLRGDDPSGLGFEVEKVGEEFEASSGGGFFGELGSRATVMQERAMKILETVNAVLRTIINLIYDLKEFDMRLQAYTDANSNNKEEKLAGEYSLKGIWMDQVDTKTGLGSINQLTRGDLQFVTLRDAFMQAKTLKDINKMDLNKRVKIIIKKKFEEYKIWREESEKELRKRYDIEKNYLRSQVDSLKLYNTWAKPYLRAAQKLGMKEFKTKKGLPHPDMITAFNNMRMDLELVGKKEFKPAKVHPSYKNLKFKEKYYTVLETQFLYRTAPQVAQSGQSQHYAHMGTIDVWFRAYVFDDKDLDDIYSQEVYENMALVEELTDFSLERLQDDLDTYLYPEKKKEEKIKEKEDIFAGLKEGFKSLGNILPSGEKTAGNFEHKRVKKEAQIKAKSSCFTLYDVFKKAHRMITW